MFKLQWNFEHVGEPPNKAKDIIMLGEPLNKGHVGGTSE